MTLKYKNKYMTFEKQADAKDSFQENKEKYDKAFEEDLQKPDFDKKAFWELTSWIPYDEKISKEENLRNAFDAKVSTLIDQNLKNLTPENKAELEALKKKASSSLTNPKELVDAFSEVQSEINNRNWESAKAWEDSRVQNEANSKRITKELQDFVDKLRTSINEQKEANDKKAQDKKAQAEEVKKAEIEQKNQAEVAIAGFPTPEKTEKKA